MKTHNTLPVIALVGAFALLGAVMFLAETPSPVSAQSQASVPAHSRAVMTSKAVIGKASIAAAAHPRPSLAGLTKIEILPASISIMGPRYNQRLLVEGTFADGHQEELTPQATLAISNPKVATIDHDNFALPQGDGASDHHRYAPGPSSQCNCNRQRLCGRDHLEFSQRCAAGHDQDGL